MSPLAGPMKMSLFSVTVLYSVWGLLFPSAPLGCVSASQENGFHRGNSPALECRNLAHEVLCQGPRKDVWDPPRISSVGSWGMALFLLYVCCTSVCVVLGHVYMCAWICVSGELCASVCVHSVCPQSCDLFLVLHSPPLLFL